MFWRQRLANLDQTEHLPIAWVVRNSIGADKGPLVTPRHHMEHPTNVGSKPSIISVKYVLWQLDCIAFSRLCLIEGVTGIIVAGSLACS